jgi:hypothetical protein
MLNLAPGRNVIPGSESMMSSYDRIMGEFGLDAKKEQEQAQRKIVKDFMENASRGMVQGKGKFGKVFKPTAQGFNEYLAADAAYNLHQGEGGRTWDEKNRKGQHIGGLSASYG